MENRDAVDAAPEVYKTLFENDRVRVLEVTGVPGVVSPLHSHPDSVMYAVDAAEILVTDAGGDSKRFEIPEVQRSGIPQRCTRSRTSDPKPYA